MTVASIYRNPLDNQLAVQMKCMKLYAHALHAVNPKSRLTANVPKVLKSRIESTAFNAVNCVNAANKQRLDDQAERICRRELQAKAKALLNEHQTALTALHAYKRLPARKLAYWMKLIEESEAILKRWVNSDVKRIEKNDFAG